MQKQFLSLSLITLVCAMVTLTGCWRKKECCPRTEPCHEIVAPCEENSCHRDVCCPEEGSMVADEDMDDEVASSNERVSGPRGWPKDAVK